MYEHIDNESQVRGTCKLTKNNVCCQIYSVVAHIPMLYRCGTCAYDFIHNRTIIFILNVADHQTSNTKHTHTHT